jgi:hypothetical protein
MHSDQPPRFPLVHSSLLLAGGAIVVNCALFALYRLLLVSVTSGGAFSTATSVPKVTWEETTRRFASHELHGYYSSLPHVLGSNNYTHYFCEAFRLSLDNRICPQDLPQQPGL